jgi:hypothetical protein
MAEIQTYKASGSIGLIKTTSVKSERFSVREFVVDLPGDMGQQRVTFQMVNQKCDLLDAFEVGDQVNVEFKLGGREWQGDDGKTRFFNSLNVMSMQRSTSAPTSSEIQEPGISPATGSSTSSGDDVPF